ncbi:MAG: metal ABC transporter permease [Polyangiaceae bacterium]|nr:metal ABC transporter permease [Polyangiaceae bacterium]
MPDPSADFDAILTAPPVEVSSAPSARAGGPLVASTRLPPFASPAEATVELVAAPTAPSLADFAENFPLYRDPVLAGTFAGLVLGLAGVFIVLRRAVFVTAAVSQSAALGVACAFLLAIYTDVELPPVLLAFVFGGTGAVALAFGTPARLPREGVVGIVYLASGSLAIIVGERISQEAHDVASLLFGSAVLVRPLDLWLILGVGSVATSVLVALTRPLEFSGFDPDAARVQGVPVRGLEALLWLIVSAEVAVTTRALGALPVFAFAVLPAFGALRLTERLPACLALAALFGAVSGGVGYVTAFLLDLPVGASQTAVATVLAIGATVGSRWR